MANKDIQPNKQDDKQNDAAEANDDNRQAQRKTNR